MTYLRSWSRAAVTLGLVVVGMAAVAHAAPVPEIDATSGVSAIALLSGAVLIIRGRNRK